MMAHTFVVLVYRPYRIATILEQELSYNTRDEKWSCNNNFSPTYPKNTLLVKTYDQKDPDITIMKP
jgi:hypothetical protein